MQSCSCDSSFINIIIFNLITTKSGFLSSFSLCVCQSWTLPLFNLHCAFNAGNHTKIHCLCEAHGHGGIIRGATSLLLSTELGLLVRRARRAKG